MSTFKQFLNDIHACDDAKLWIGSRGLKSAWRDCDRPDWMCWFLLHLNADQRELRAWALGVLEPEMHRLPVRGGSRFKAVDLLRQWISDDSSSDRELMKTVNRVDDLVFIKGSLPARHIHQAVSYICDTSFSSGIDSGIDHLMDACSNLDHVAWCDQLRLAFPYEAVLALKRESGA